MAHLRSAQRACASLQRSTLLPPSIVQQLVVSKGAHRAEVSAIKRNAHVCIDDGNVLDPAVGSGPKVQRVEACLSAKAFVGCLRELDGQVLDTNLLPGQRCCMKRRRRQRRRSSSSSKTPPAFKIGMLRAHML